MFREMNPSTNARVSSAVEMSFEIQGSNAQLGVESGGSGIGASMSGHAGAPESGMTTGELHAAEVRNRARDTRAPSRPTRTPSSSHVREARASPSGPDTR